MQTTKTTVMVEFAAFGEAFEPETITKCLGIEPTETWIKGEPIGSTTRKETNWSIRTGYEESWNVGDQLKKILGLIKDKRELLKELKVTYGLVYKFFIVIKIEKEYTPALVLDLEFIEFANDIQAEIDVDLYANCACDEYRGA